MKHKQLCALIAAALMSAAAFNATATATGQTTAFTYQGQLSNFGGLVSSSQQQSFTFTLYDSLTGGAKVLTNPVTGQSPDVASAPPWLTACSPLTSILALRFRASSIGWKLRLTDKP